MKPTVRPSSKTETNQIKPTRPNDRNQSTKKVTTAMATTPKTTQTTKSANKKELTTKKTSKTKSKKAKEKIRKICCKLKQECCDKSFFERTESQPPTQTPPTQLSSQPSLSLTEPTQPITLPQTTSTQQQTTSTTLVITVTPTTALTSTSIRNRIYIIVLYRNNFYCFIFKLIIII